MRENFEHKIRPFLSAQTQVEEEGYQISKSSIMVVDLTSRPYFVGNLPVPEFQAQKGQTNILTLTEGIVGPIVPQFPLNITTILDLPKVCEDSKCVLKKPLEILVLEFRLDLILEFLYFTACAY